MPAEAVAVLSFLPAWLVLAALLGVINAGACFMLVGRRVSHLAWYVVIGALAASVGQVFSLAVQAPTPLAIGELNVVVASAFAWMVLGAARVARL